MVPSTPATLCGSFRRAPELLRAEHAALLTVGVRVLSPCSVKMDVERGGFVFMHGERGHAPGALEDRHLSAIRASRFVWLHAPGGYVGVAGALEIGYAVACGVPVYASVEPDDVAVKPYVRVVTGPEVAVQECAA